MSTLLDKLKIEFIGTFLSTYFCGLLVLQCSIHGIYEIAMASGIMLIFTLVTYLGKNISGAQFNPVITLSIAITGRQSFKDAGIMIGVQFFSALFASSLLVNSVPSELFGAVAPFSMIGLPTNSETNVFLQIFLELLGAFFLVFGYFMLMFDSRTANEHTAPGIGMLYLSLTILMFERTGAMLNLARLFGYVIVSSTIRTSWIYIIANPIGGIAGGFLAHGLIRMNQKKEESLQESSEIVELND